MPEFVFAALEARRPVAEGRLLFLPSAKMSRRWHGFQKTDLVGQRP